MILEQATKGNSMKGCNLFLSTLIIATILVGIYAVHMYMAAMTPVWSSTAMQQAQIDLQASMVNTRTDVQAHVERSQLITGTLQGVGMGIVLLLFGFGGVYIWKQYDMRRESWARAVDGTFALQPFNHAGQIWTVDPNKSIFGVIGQDKRTGQLATDASMVGPDRQLEYAKTVQKTRTVAASTAGGPIKYVAHAKGIFGNQYDRPYQADMPQLPVQDNGDDMATWQPLTLADAFHKSEPDRWLLGQNDQGACEFDIFSTVHTGLLGATKCGKTSSTALLMAMNAVNHGMKVIALDGVDGVDWLAYNDVFEVYETDYTLIGDQLEQISRLHEQRMKALKLAGKPNIDELDYHIPGVLVILEEFGRTMQSFRSANKSQCEATESALSALMRVSRKTGIYFLLIDQSMAGWSQEIKPNVKDYIAYHLGGNQGNAFNAYDLHKLKAKGQFWNNGNVYDAWYTRGEAKQLLRELPKRKVNLLTDAQHNVGLVDHNRSIVDGGESTGQAHTSIYSRPTIDNSKSSPVSYKSIVDDNPSISSIVDERKPQLTGKPVSAKEKELVRNTYALTGQYRKTCELLWGKWNPSRDAWAKAIVNEVLQ